MRRWCGFGKNKVILGREEHAEKWTKETQRAETKCAQLVSVFSTLCPASEMPADQSDCPLKEAVSFVFIDIKAWPRVGIMYYFQEHGYRVIMSYTWRWFSSLFVLFSPLITEAISSDRSTHAAWQLMMAAACPSHTQGRTGVWFNIALWVLRLIPIFPLPPPLAQRLATSPNEVSQAGHERPCAIHEHSPDPHQREKTLMIWKQEDKQQVTEMMAGNPPDITSV